MRDCPDAFDRTRGALDVALHDAGLRAVGAEQLGEPLIESQANGPGLARRRQRVVDLPAPTGPITRCSCGFDDAASARRVA